MRLVDVTNQHPRLRVDRQALIDAIRQLDAGHTSIRVPRPAFLQGTLSIVFLTDAALARLHGQFLEDPTVTDVITFDGDPAFGAAGEICVSADAAARQVRAFKGANAFSTELMLYVVHGWLH